MDIDNSDEDNKQQQRIPLPNPNRRNKFQNILNRNQPRNFKNATFFRGIPNSNLGLDML